MIYLAQIIYQNIQTSDDKKEICGISYDALVTGFVPIVLFISGYLINVKVKQINEKCRLIELEKYFYSLVTLLEKPLQSQIQEFIMFSDKLIEKKDQHLVLNENTSFHIEQFKEIDSKDLYDIFIKNKKGSIPEKTELYGKLRGGLDYIDSITKAKRKDFDFMNEKFIKYQEDYFKEIEITDESFRFMCSLSVLKEDDLFLREMGRIMSEWSSFSSPDVSFKDRTVAREMYIMPMIELCKKHIDDPRAVFIGNHIKRCIYALNNNDELKSFFSTHYTTQATKLQTSWLNINDALKKFDTMKKTSWVRWFIKTKQTNTII